MISAEDLVALVRNYNPKTNADRIIRAYEFGKQMHEGQFRHSGEPYFSHPVAVAAILTEQRLDDATIIPRTFPTYAETQSELVQTWTMFSPIYVLPCSAPLMYGHVHPHLCMAPIVFPWVGGGGIGKTICRL